MFVARYADSFECGRRDGQFVQQVTYIGALAGTNTPELSASSSARMT